MGDWEYKGTTNKYVVAMQHSWLYVMEYTSSAVTKMKTLTLSGDSCNPGGGGFCVFGAAWMFQGKVITPIRPLPSAHFL